MTRLAVKPKKGGPDSRETEIAKKRREKNAESWQDKEWRRLVGVDRKKREESGDRGIGTRPEEAPF